MAQRTATARPAPKGNPAATLLVGGLFAVALALAGAIFWNAFFATSSLPSSDPLAPEGVHVKGDAGAPVTIVRFTDFQCAECAAFAREIQPLLESEFVESGVARLVLRHFPVVGQESAYAAEAAECAAEQGKFWEYSTVLHGWNGRPNTGYFSEELLINLAQGLRISTRELKTCLRGGTKELHVARDLSDGVALGLASPMALYVNGRQVRDPMDYDQLRLHVVGAAAGS